MRPARRPAVAIAFLIGTLAAVGAAEALVGPAPEPAPPTAAEPGADAVSGRSTCALADARPGVAAAVDVVRPGTAGDAPANADVVEVDGAGTDVLGTTRLFPGAASRTSLEGDETTAVDVRWSGAPTATLRTWRTSGEEDLPPGTAAGPCPAGTAASSWTVPGLTTEGGHEARLRLTNPHGTGATVAVGFLTPEGPDDPTRLRNVSIGARESVELVLNDYLPEQPDLSVVVEVASGRVAVEGVQLTRSAIGGIDGVSLLQAATGPAETWTVPWVVDGEGRSSWLWIANRSDRSAPVELTYHTPDGGAVPELLAEVAVPPGTVRRVDLTGTLPEGVEGAAITARSDGVPVVVSGTAELSGSDPDDTGFAVQLGAPATDATWALAGSYREGRIERLRLINPGSEPATVDAVLWNGSQATRPAELTGIEVPAGALVTVALEDLLSGPDVWALTVQATSGEVVAATVGSGDPDGPRHLVVGTGVPSAWWTTPRSPVRRAAPGTAQRLGTELGIEPVDPLAPVEDGVPGAPAAEERDDAEGSTPEVDAPDEAGADG